MLNNANSSPVRIAIEISVYLFLIFAIAAWSLQILNPFISLILWGTVIAVAVHKPFLKLREKLGGSSKLAVTIFTVLGLTIIILPTWMFADSLIESAQHINSTLESGEFNVPPANESVKEWPLIGEKLYKNWSDAANNMQGWLTTHSDQIKPLLQKAVSSAAGIGMAALQFVFATLIAAAMLAHDETMVAKIERFFRRLVGDRGPEVLGLTSATVRSVAVGVLGIAFIQAVAGGAGMMLAGVPGAGLWAVLILILAIAQLPPLLVLLPAIIYVFSANDSTTVAVLFTVWSIVVSFSDAALKPLLLGRGVEAPMIVILLGAIGGLVHSGFIGLFLGAVILALAYKLFIAWLESGEEAEAEAEPEEV